MRLLKTLGIAALALALVAPSAFGADENTDYEGVPAYDVARLKVFEGSAWVRTSDSGDWEEFPSNSPVPARSVVSIPDDSEAELQFHGGQYVLLTAGTDLELRAFGSERSEFRLRSGEIRFYMPETDFAPVEVVLPAGEKADFAVPGRYWLTAAKEQSTLIVRDGKGTVSGQRGDFHVDAGERAVIGREVQIGRYSGEETDSFKKPPPLSEEEKQAGVPPAAAHELRDYGEWVQSSEYGTVWRPRVSVDWSPYYYGRWVWISPYGWTWVSEEPWGWYPYHYGYWCSDPFFGWVWSPFHAFVSFEFVFGGRHYHEFQRHARFVPASVRFVRDGVRVRWIPLRPGQRVRRIAFTRSDARLASWRRPLRRDTVYVRRAGTRGGGWRDWTAVRGERRAVGAVPRALPGARNGGGRPGAERAVRGRGEGNTGRTGRGNGERRSRETIRGKERPARERPSRPERMERESPASSRPGRRSQLRFDRPEKTTPEQRYGYRVRGSVRVPAQVRSGRAERAAPGVAVPRPAAPRRAAPRRAVTRRAESRAGGAWSVRAKPRATAPRIREPERGRGVSRFFSGGGRGRAEGGGRRSGEREFGFGGRGGRGGGRFTR